MPTYTTVLYNTTSRHQRRLMRLERALEAGDPIICSKINCGRKAVGACSWRSKCENFYCKHHGEDGHNDWRGLQIPGATGDICVECKQVKQQKKDISDASKKYIWGFMFFFVGIIAFSFPFWCPPAPDDPFSICLPWWVSPFGILLVGISCGMCRKYQEKNERFDAVKWNSSAEWAATPGVAAGNPIPTSALTAAQYAHLRPKQSASHASGSCSASSQMSEPLL